MVNIKELLHVHERSLGLVNVNHHVRARVFENLKLLIPDGIEVKPEAGNVFCFAVSQLCTAESVEKIDWLKLVGLAGDICKLWSSNWTKGE